MPELRKCDAACDDDLKIIAQSRQEKKVVRLKKSRTLAQQNWRDWLSMAETTLAGVSQTGIPHMEPSQPVECDSKPLDGQFAFE